MTIGIYDPYLDDVGGGEKYMMTLANVLSKEHSVEVFWDKKEDLESVSKRFSLDFSNVKLVPNIFSSNTPFLKRLLTTKKYDAIVYLSDGSIPTVLAKKLFIHFQQPLPYVRVDGKTKLKLARVTKFFCNSAFTKSYIDKTYGLESDVIYPPVDTHAKKVRKENIILTVGRFRVRDVLTGNSDFKKQSILIDAFKDMVNKGLKNWRFVLAVSVREADEKAFEKLKEETSSFPIEFLVNKTNEQLWQIYSKAKIYWHGAGFGEDLEKYPQYAEHFGISTVEAMGAGAVPVVINAGGQKEIVADGKEGFLWNRLDELKEKTELLITDAKLLDHLSKMAANKAKTFGKDRFTKEIYELVKV